MAENKAQDLDLLEEDDEFEEFQRETWGAAQEDDEDTKLWGDDWDDDDVDEGFATQLRAELKQVKAGGEEMKTTKG
eukprot:CAMPEP_0205818942 /NCGR_PEP_ID=MMETSP0206-20130828/1059_1 /ASSEMBLY_ACC=CAM_ASM_000279 /TAXON_ID=36767 /ORGANISM="Euplotes focardii, Strain TN1" /LENGTH=75 /DNA_ID=CAMNT_0053111857 /DNA_START=36 /DNA_END=261 /DNA_ORIENTATION=+